MSLTKSVSDLLTRTRVHVDAPASQGAFGSASAGAFRGVSQTGHAARHPRRQARGQAESRKWWKCPAPAAPPPGDRRGDRAPGMRPDPAPPTTWVTGSVLTQVVRGKKWREEGAVGEQAGHG